MTSDADSPDEPKQGAKPREMFSVNSSVSGKGETFEDPREVGRAFFLADPAERPSVTHMMGNSARTMARTEVHGSHQSGEPKYFKSLPSSHAPDAAFREGFLEAMEHSLNERLGHVAAIEGTVNATHSITRLIDDLESFAYRVPERAAQLWVGHGTEISAGPVLKAAVGSYAADIGRKDAAGRTRDGEVSSLSQRPSEHKLATNSSRVSKQSKDWER